MTRAEAAAAAAARRRARNHSLRRDGLVLLLAVVVLVGAWSVREVPNEDLPPALVLTRRLDDTYRAVRAGDVVLGTEPDQAAAGISGARFPRTTRPDRWVLVGEAGSDCYVLWWDEAGARRVRTLPSDLPCEPSTEAMSSRPGTAERIGHIVEESAPTAAWETVLPAPRRLRLWFLPALIVGGGVGLSALVRMHIALLTNNAPSATRR